jgi:hypothetical protein
MISLPGTMWGHIGSLDMLEYKVMKSLASSRFVGPESFLGVTRQNITREIKRWMDNQCLVLWCGPCGIERQAG